MASFELIGTLALDSVVEAAVASTSADAADAAQSATEAEAAKTAAQAVGTTNDTVMANVANNPATAFSTAMTTKINNQTAPAVTLAQDSATAAAASAAAAAASSTAAAVLREQAQALSPAWAAIRNCANSPFDIVVPGDSMSEGTGATEVANRGISKMIDYLRLRYQPSTAVGGVGYVPTLYIASTLVTKGWTRAGTTSTSTSGGLGLRKISLDADGASVSITRACTSFTFFYGNFTTGTKFTINIDGVDAATVTTLSTPVGHSQKWDSAALAAGNHTITVTRATGSAAAVSVEGAMFYNGDETKGIRLWDAAHHGFRSSQYLNVNWRGPFVNKTAPDPDLLIYALGYNDDGNDIPVADFKTNTLSVLSTFRSNYPRLPVLFLAYPTRAGAVDWHLYVEALQQIAADDTFATLLDTRNLVPADWIANYTTDGTHPNDAGHAIIGNLLGDFLLPR